MYHFFTHFSVNGHIGCFNNLAIVNSTAVNVGVYVSVWITVFSGYKSRDDIICLYDSSTFSFLRKLQTVLLSDCTNLCSHQQYSWELFYSYPLKCLWFVDFLMIPILTSVRWYSMVVLICISLIICDIKHLSVCCFWKNNKRKPSLLIRNTEKKKKLLLIPIMECSSKVLFFVVFSLLIW